MYNIRPALSKYRQEILRIEVDLCHPTLCEKYSEGNKDREDNKHLDMVFVDLEKAYDTVLR